MSKLAVASYMYDLGREAARQAGIQPGMEKGGYAVRMVFFDTQEKADAFIAMLPEGDVAVVRPEKDAYLSDGKAPAPWRVEAARRFEAGDDPQAERIGIESLAHEAGAASRGHPWELTMELLVFDRDGEPKPTAHEVLESLLEDERDQAA